MQNLKKVAGLGGVALGAGLVVSALSIVVLWRIFRDHPAFWSEHKATQLTLRAIDQAIAEYRQQGHQLPASLTELGPPDLLRPYLDQRGRIVDGWGQPFGYSVRGEHYLLLSYGRDGKPGGMGLDYDLSDRNRLPPEGAPTLCQFVLDRPTGGVLLTAGMVGIVTVLSVLVLWWPFVAERDWGTGTIRSNSGDVIARPCLSLQGFLASPLGGSASVERVTPAHLRATVSRKSIGGYECWAQWEFEDGILRALLIGVTDSTAERLQFTTGYASPPDGPEVAFLEEWVRREVGRTPPLRFSWGESGQVYDPVAGFARIRFGYRPPRHRPVPRQRDRTQHRPDHQPARGLRRGGAVRG